MAKHDPKWGHVTMDDLDAILGSLPNPKLKEGENQFWRHENGSYFAAGVSLDILEALKTWNVREDDTFLVTYPKAGTTWMQQILRLIYQADDVESGKKMERHLFFAVPFLELAWINSLDQHDIVPPNHVVLESVPSPRLVKSHLEFSVLPPVLREGGNTDAKIVYVARNPKDLVVSYYFFCQEIPIMPNYLNFSDFLRDFLDNKVYGGYWFKENLYWWNRRHDPNVFFVKFEDMKHDLRSIVVQVCDFLGRSLSDKLIDQIVDKSTFKSMKENPVSNPDSMGIYKGSKKSFMRKGQIGDWKNYFTVAESEEFDALYRRKMAGSSLRFDFGE